MNCLPLMACRQGQFPTKTTTHTNNSNENVQKNIQNSNNNRQIKANREQREN